MRKLRVWTMVLAALAVASGTALAQERQITGTVTRSAGGQPMTEATISVTGSSATAKTNEQGKYSIDVGPGEVRLVIRAIGYRSEEVVVEPGQETADAALSEDIFNLEEVVVTGQATGTDRRSSTTSTAVVDGTDVSQVQAQSLDRALQGRIAGANIQTNSGAPGAGCRYRFAAPTPRSATPSRWWWWTG